jgi:hypothetical protein
MRKFLNSATAALVLASMVVGKPASAHDKPSWIYGAGTVSCMEWSGHADDSLAYHIHLSWVLGYISAANEFVPMKNTDRYAVETGSA